MTSTLHAAMAAAHGDLTNPGKDGTANYGRYSTLAGTLDHIRPVLAKHGLYVSQDVSNDDTHLFIRTTVAHASGEVLDFGPLTWPMVDKIQTLGGLVTYCRRYALMAALSLSGVEDDDDGQDANSQASRDGRTPNPRNLTGPARRDLTGKATDKQVAAIVGIMRGQGLNEVALNTLTTAELGFEMPVGGVKDLTKGQASALIDRMKNAKVPGRDYDPPPGRDGTPPHTGPMDDPWVIPDPPEDPWATAGTEAK